MQSSIIKTLYVVLYYFILYKFIFEYKFEKQNNYKMLIGFIKIIVINIEDATLIQLYFSNPK